jgi:hypothetical protein
MRDPSKAAPKSIQLAIAGVLWLLFYLADLIGSGNALVGVLGAAVVLVFFGYAWRARRTERR